MSLSARSLSRLRLAAERFVLSSGAFRGTVEGLLLLPEELQPRSFSVCSRRKPDCFSDSRPRDMTRWERCAAELLDSSRRASLCPAEE